MIEPQNEVGSGPAPLRGRAAARWLPNLGGQDIAILGVLAASGKIGSAEMIAANRWYHVYAMACDGVFEITGNSSGGGPVKLLEQERRVAAASQYRRTREAIGDAADARLRAALVDGCNLKQLAERIGRDYRTAAKVLARDLAVLARVQTELCSKKDQIH